MWEEGARSGSSSSLSSLSSLPGHYRESSSSRRVYGTDFPVLEMNPPELAQRCCCCGCVCEVRPGRERASGVWVGSTTTAARGRANAQLTGGQAQGCKRQRQAWYRGTLSRVHKPKLTSRGLHPGRPPTKDPCPRTTPEASATTSQGQSPISVALALHRRDLWHASSPLAPLPPSRGHQAIRVRHRPHPTSGPSSPLVPSRAFRPFPQCIRAPTSCSRAACRAMHHGWRVDRGRGVRSNTSTTRRRAPSRPATPSLAQAASDGLACPSLPHTGSSESDTS